MEKKRRFSTIIMASILLGSLIFSIIAIPVPAAASTGTITIFPGETRYLSFGYAGTNELLLWSFSVIHSSGVVTYWLEAPNGTHYVLPWATWGKITDDTGFWKWAFQVPSSASGDAMIGYEMYLVVPQIHITAPMANSYLNSTDVNVEGTVDQDVTSISISSDKVHYTQADQHLTSWMGNLNLSEGIQTIYAEATYEWGSFWAKFYVSVDVTVDFTAPIITDIKLNGKQSATDIFIESTVRIDWGGTDLTSGVDHFMIRLDDGDWILILNYMPSGYAFHNLSDGGHTLTIKAVDRAGNTAISVSAFTIDTNPFSMTGPYSGLPLFIIIAALAGGIILTLILLIRRGYRARMYVIQPDRSVTRPYQPFPQPPFIEQRPQYVPQSVPAVIQITSPLAQPVQMLQPALQMIPPAAVQPPAAPMVEWTIRSTIAAPQPMTQAPSSVAPRIAFCPHCGKPIESGSFCTHCGKRLA